MKEFSLLIKIIIPISILLSACASQKMAELPTVNAVEIARYCGTWHEIARLPNRFEKGLESVTANYTLRSDGKITVLNKGFSVSDNEWSTAKGRAWVPDVNYPGRLKVEFFWPFAGDYYILELAPDYTYVLIGAPKRNFLWILGRKPVMDEVIYQQLIEKAKSLGFPVEKIEKVPYSQYKM